MQTLKLLTILLLWRAKNSICHYILHFKCRTACILCSPVSIYSFNISSKGILTLSAMSSKAWSQMTRELNQTHSIILKSGRMGREESKVKILQMQCFPGPAATIFWSVSPRRKPLLFHQLVVTIHFSFWLIYLLISENRTHLKVSVVRLLPAALLCFVPMWFHLPQ